MSTSNQTIVALRNELRMLRNDLESISCGQAGSTFAVGDKDKLKARIHAMQKIIDDLEAVDARDT